ncbi:MAG: xanthine dehydrogenase family protein subunit M [Ferruginibacter sp.]
MLNFDYVRPTTQQSALNAIKKNKNSAFIAGGTNLVDLMKRGVATPEKLVDISRLPMKEISLVSGNIRIGAGALNSTVAENDLILKNAPLLSKALHAGASPQIRNMATVGGNMLQRTRCPYFYDTALPCNKRAPGTGCSAVEGYSRMHAIFGASNACIAVHPSDMCVALAALDAVVVIANNKTERRLAFTDFHRLPGDKPNLDNNLQAGELIIAVEIPEKNLFSEHTAYVKVRDRSSYAFALVSVAAALSLNGNSIREARLAMGGVAHKPWRLTAAENFLRGKSATEDIFKEAGRIAMQDAKAYPGNKFKLTLAPNAIIEALKQAAGI